MPTTTPDARITIGNRYFVPVGKLTDTLFYRGGTASGEYRILRRAGRIRGVLFYAPDKAPRAFLVLNNYGERFFVTAHRDPNNRVRYMFGLAESDRQFLALPESCAEQRAIADTIADAIAE